MPADYSNIFATVHERVIAASNALIASGALPALDLSRVVVEPPRDATHGDMATNAAMVLAKDAKKKPRELADLIAEKLRADGLIEKVDVAGPGFINLTLKPAVWADALRTAIQSASITAAVPAMAIRSMSNMSRPIRPARCMSAIVAAPVFGDALANLLDFAGFKVTREYYINDAARRSTCSRAPPTAIPRSARRDDHDPRRPLSRLTTQGRRLKR
jgi:arginyl-tRNA synthetase